MKKIIITLGLLVAASILAWVYLATEFEHIAKNEILPKLTNSKYISVDPDSVVIEKFKFKITLKDVSVFPQSKSLKMFTDRVVACYNPFTDKIIVRLGDKTIQGSGKIEAYTQSKDQKIEFNRSLLNNKFEDVNILISSGEAAMYLASDDSLISRLEKSNVSLTSKLDKNGFYNTDLKLDISGSKYGPSGIKYTEYVKDEVMAEFYPELDAQQKGDKEYDKLQKAFTKLQHDHSRIIGEIEPINTNLVFSLKLGKTHVENIILALKGELHPKELYQNFSFSNDNYNLSFDVKNANSYELDEVSYNLSGDGKELKSDFDILLTTNYTDEQKKHLAESIVELLNTLTKQSLLQEDLKGVLDKYLDTKKMNFSFNLNYDIELHTAHHSLELVIDNLKVNSDGSLKEQKYDGTFKLATPKILISGISDLYDGGGKLLLQKTDATTLNNINVVVENIKNNGMSLLSAFDKKENLKENDNFESNVTFSLENFEFQVNGKGILKLLTDERVVKFLKAMPSAETETGSGAGAGTGSGAKHD